MDCETKAFQADLLKSIEQMKNDEAERIIEVEPAAVIAGDDGMDFSAGDELSIEEPPGS